MPPVRTGFADKLWLWDLSPGPDKLQVLRGSSSQMGSQLRGKEGGRTRQLLTENEEPVLCSARIPRPLPMSTIHLLPLPRPAGG